MADAGVPQVHAHRGDSSNYPENTMAAFRSAGALGADAVEFDVHMTLDGHLVVVHDYDLGRTTDGTGLVHQRELSYVRSLDAGSWFGPEHGDERVPLVEEVLSLDDIAFEMELKGVPSRDLVRAVAGVVRDLDVLDRVRFTGFHWVTLMALLAELPGACLGLFARDPEPWMSDRLYEDIVTETALTGGYRVVHLHHRHLHKVDVDRLHRLGLLLHSGETDGTPSEVLALGVDGLTTDRPGMALRARSAWLEDRRH